MPYCENLNTWHPSSPESEGKPINQEALDALEEALTALREFERKVRLAHDCGAKVEDCIGWCQDAESDITAAIERLEEGEDE